MIGKDIHFVDIDDNNFICFFPHTKRFFKINRAGKDLLAALDSKVIKAEVLRKFNISEETYLKYLKMFLENKAPEQKPVSINNFNPYHSKKLDRLVINVSNDCNLNCVYCYANGGSYKSDKSIMNKKTMDSVLNCFYSYFNNISYIQFFGGEPFLNIPLIEYACEKISYINKGKEKKTTFGAVTNGTILNDKIIKLIKKYNIKITVSYDGDVIVNNITRPNKKNINTSETIVNNIRTLKEKTGQPYQIEATYTNYHVKHNISVLDIAEHINNLFPNILIHTAPAGGCKTCSFVLKNYAPFIDSVFKYFQKLKNGNKQIPSYSLLQGVLSELANKENKHTSLLCPAGSGTLSVSVTGNIYPCFMVIDEESLNMGSVFDPNIFLSKQFNTIQNKTCSFLNAQTNTTCNSCFARKLCSNCLGFSLLDTGNPFKLSDESCIMTKKMAEKAMIGLTYL